MNIREITLEEMLNQRELRHNLILEIKKRFPQSTIISYKLNIPGPIKNNSHFQYAFQEGLKLLKNYDLLYDFRNNVTGPEAILVSQEDPNKLKAKMIDIEDNFELGRLYDLDVTGVNRSNLNIPARKCLICEDDAHGCSRSRKHNLDDVLDTIYSLIESYKND